MPRKSELGVAEWVDPDDAPELTDAFFDAAVWEVGGVRVPPPRKRGPAQTETELRLHLDAEVAGFFKTSEPGWEDRITAVLRDAMRRS